jgi:hypothetical protein
VADLRDYGGPNAFAIPRNNGVWRVGLLFLLVKASQVFDLGRQQAEGLSAGHSPRASRGAFEGLWGPNAFATPWKTMVSVAVAVLTVPLLWRLMQAERSGKSCNGHR